MQLTSKPYTLHKQRARNNYVVLRFYQLSFHSLKSTSFLLSFKLLKITPQIKDDFTKYSVEHGILSIRFWIKTV
jgi:hypothetical protein